MHYTHKALLDATVHIITLPEVLRATLYGGVAILLSPVPPTLPIASKAPCLLFHSPLYLPEERPHFNINRMLHHAVAQTSPCCIAPVALAAAAKGRRTRRGDGAPVARRQKKQTCFVIVFKRPVWFVLSARHNMEKYQQRNMMLNSNKTEECSDGQRWGLFPSDLIQSTNWASLKHKIEQQSILPCQYASGLAQT